MLATLLVSAQTSVVDVEDEKGSLIMIHPLKRFTVGILLATLAISAIASVGISPLEAHASQVQARTPTRVLLARATGGLMIMVPSGKGVQGDGNAYFGSFETDLYGYCTPGCGSYYAVSSACHVKDAGLGADQYYMQCRLLRNGSQVYGSGAVYHSGPFSLGSPEETNWQATWKAQLAGSETNSTYGVVANSDNSVCGHDSNDDPILCAAPDWGVTASFTL